MKLERRDDAWAPHLENPKALSEQFGECRFGLRRAPERHPVLTAAGCNLTSFYSLQHVTARRLSARRSVRHGVGDEQRATATQEALGFAVNGAHFLLIEPM